MFMELLGGESCVNFSAIRQKPCNLSRFYRIKQKRSAIKEFLGRIRIMQTFPAPRTEPHPSFARCGFPPFEVGAEKDPALSFAKFELRFRPYAQRADHDTKPGARKSSNARFAKKLGAVTLPCPPRISRAGSRGFCSRVLPKPQEPDFPRSPHTNEPPIAAS